MQEKRAEEQGRFIFTMVVKTAEKGADITFTMVIRGAEKRARVVFTMVFWTVNIGRVMQWCFNQFFLIIAIADDSFSLSMIQIEKFVLVSNQCLISIRFSRLTCFLAGNKKINDREVMVTMHKELFDSYRVLKMIERSWLQCIKNYLTMCLKWSRGNGYNA